MTISVIIATYNRARQVATCLAQLERQHFLPGDEVIVVNNGSTDDTPRVLRELAARMGGFLRVVDEPRPGKSAAVARAVRDGHGDVLAFTDDDVLVADDWLRSIRRAMEAEDVALIGGQVLPLYEDRVPDWLDLNAGDAFGRMAAPLALLNYGCRRIALEHRVLLGANMAIRRDAFLAAGGFPLDLGKLRGTLLSGEDHELCERVQAAGYSAVYDPSIRVRHLVPADRMRLGYFLRWFFWSGVTHAALDKARRHPAGRSVLGVPGHVVKQLGAAAVKTFASLLRASWSTAADQATRTTFAAGYMWSTWKGRAAARPRLAPGRRAEAA